MEANHRRFEVEQTPEQQEAAMYEDISMGGPGGGGAVSVSTGIRTLHAGAIKHGPNALMHVLTIEVGVIKRIGLHL